MKTVISAKDIQDLLRTGGDVKSLPTDALLTPSARDLLRELDGHGARAGGWTARTLACPARSRGSRAR